MERCEPNRKNSPWNRRTDRTEPIEPKQIYRTVRTGSGYIESIPVWFLRSRNVCMALG